jgi:hypothetical protein
MISLGRPRDEWENIETNYKGTGYEDVDWIHLAKIGRGDLLLQLVI